MLQNIIIGTFLHIKKTIQILIPACWPYFLKQKIFRLFKRPGDFFTLNPQRFDLVVLHAAVAVLRFDGFLDRFELRTQT